MSIFSRISLGAAAAATAAVAACTVTVAAAQTPAAPVAAERITNPVAEFAGIDKITGRIITFDVYI
ncbi:MAG: DUF2155 domain-containing protein, partial [Mesorhizobium sp.]